MPNAAEYFAQMCKEAGLDDSTTSALTALANNEKLSPKFDSLVKRATEDFDAQTGRVKAAESRVKQYDDWYVNADAAVKQANANYQAAQAELARLSAGGDPAGFDASKYLTKEDLVNFNREQAERTARVIKDAQRVSNRHFAKFGEELDLDALDQFAQKEGGIPIPVAYDRFVQPKVEAKQKEAFEKEKKEFADSAVRDALSRHQLPVDASPAASSIMFREVKADAPQRSSDEELMATWNKAGAGKY